MLPKNAAMDRKIFSAERKISSPSTPLINSVEQYSLTMTVFWSVSYSEKLIIVIFRCEARICTALSDVFIDQYTVFKYIITFFYHLL